MLTYDAPHPNYRCLRRVGPARSTRRPGPGRDRTAWAQAGGAAAGSPADPFGACPAGEAGAEDGPAAGWAWGDCSGAGGADDGGADDGGAERPRGACAAGLGGAEARWLGLGEVTGALGEAGGAGTSDGDWDGRPLDGDGESVGRADAEVEALGETGTVEDEGMTHGVWLAPERAGKAITGLPFKATSM